jgi:transcriptional regulator with XRE-family HTH domain
LNHLYSKRQEKLCALLKECRLKAGLTQQQLADRLKRSDNFVSYVERGERTLGVLEFLDYVEAMGADPKGLLGKLIK